MSHSKADLDEIFSTKNTPQTEPIPGREEEMHEGRSGGHHFTEDLSTRLFRFLILGSPDGYYAPREEIARENARVALEMLHTGRGNYVVEAARHVSLNNRAASNDYALYVLAMALGEGDVETRRKVVEVLPEVARIPTHLFKFLEYVKAFRGIGGTLVKRAIQNWYLSKPVDQLAYHMIKYRQRHGWTHKDALLVGHVKTDEQERNALFRWVTRGGLKNLNIFPDGVPDHWPAEEVGVNIANVHQQVRAFEWMQEVDDPDIAIKLIEGENLPWEAVPTRFHNEPRIWSALLGSMPMHAMIRNLARLTSLGVLRPFGEDTARVNEKLCSREAIQKSRLHPIQILSALNIYSSGRGMRGSLTWEPVTSIVDNLNDAFYRSFDNVEPIGHKMVLAVDVSGSMFRANVVGTPGLTSAQVAATMALATAKRESAFEILGVDHKSRWHRGSSEGIRPLNISPKQRINDVIDRMRDLPGGGTDLSLVFKWALENDVDADTFVIYTDGETWAGDRHVVQRLEDYRNRINPDARVVMAATRANKSSIFAPDDPLAMTAYGFDRSLPNMIRQFARGEI